VERPPNWLARVNQSETGAELEALRTSVQRGRGGMVARLGAVQPGVIDLQQVNDQAR